MAKFFIVASSEYKANCPDMFVMDEKGRYYGVTQYSYAKFYKFPNSIDFWKGAEGSDAGRRFHIDEVDLPEEKVFEFEKITAKYAELESNKPVFGERYPEERNFKTKKEYKSAVDAYMNNHSKWLKEVNYPLIHAEIDNAWTKRVRMFLSFSDVINDCLRYNECIQKL